jgi:hypothetical protein
MTWLERVRHKNFAPYTLGSDKSAKRTEGEQKNLEHYEAGGAKSDKSLNGPASVTFDTSGTKDSEVFVEAPQQRAPEAIIVAYQRIWFDYDLRDGTYTPAELQEAKLLVKRGPVLRYRLRWPGGTPQPMDVGDTQASRLRSKRDARGTPVVEVQRRTYGGLRGPGVKHP